MSPAALLELDRENRGCSRWALEDMDWMLTCGESPPQILRRLGARHESIMRRLSRPRARTAEQDAAIADLRARYMAACEAHLADGGAPLVSSAARS